MDPFATLGNNIQPLMAKYLKHSEKNLKILKKKLQGISKSASFRLATNSCLRKQTVLQSCSEEL